jgi:TRAP-type C4-dicarboxylate transport system substrate-binding protein
MSCRFSILLLIICMSSPALAGKKIKVRGGTVAPEGTPWEQQMKNTKKHMRKASNGVIKMKVYFGGQKGDEKSLVRQVKDGRLEMYGGSTAALATEVPEIQVLELPFIFSDNKEADFILDKHLYKPVSEIVQNYGYVMYQWAENGWQNIGLTDGFVKSPADLAGRKIRSQEAPVHLLTWKMFGASPTEMPVSETLPALNTGRVDGFAQTALYTFAAGWYRGIKYYTLSRHLYQPGAVVYSKKWFDKSPEELRPILLGNHEADAAEGRKGVRRLEPGLIQNFKNYGIKVYELSAKERASFVKSAKAIRAEYTKTATPGAKRLLQVIDAAKKQYGK